MEQIELLGVLGGLLYVAFVVCMLFWWYGQRTRDTGRRL